MSIVTKMTPLLLLRSFALSLLIHFQIEYVYAFSAFSSFTGVRSSSARSWLYALPKERSQSNKVSAGGLVMYGDSPNSPELNAWSVIASTERWIAETLKSTNQMMSSSSSSFSSSMNAAGNNPYARKEVSYYCETSNESSMIVAGIFRMLKEARERGEAHGSDEEERAELLGMFKKNIIFVTTLLRSNIT
jgi:hypothetical protein